jgi:glutathione S-transferase
MKLLSATPSPFARKVRIALHEKKIPFELICEVPWNADANAPRYNPLGKIPVLIPDDGEPVYESSFILEYLDVMHPEIPMLPPDPRQRLQARRLEVLADGACDAIVLSVIETLRSPEQRSAAWIARQHGKIEAAVDEVARRIEPGARHAVGSTFGLGDIAVGCLLGYLDLRHPVLDWRRHIHLRAFFEVLNERESFQGTTPVVQEISDRVA